MNPSFPGCKKHSAQASIYRTMAVFCLGLRMMSGTDLLADSGSWDPQNNSTDWNTASNWSSDTVPNGPGQVASFTAGEGVVFVSAPISVDTITATYPHVYSIVTPSSQLTLTGAGVSSYHYLTLEQGGGPGGTGAGNLTFENSASLGQNAILNDQGGGSTTFKDSSNDGSGGGIINNPGEVAGQVGGLATFEDSSSAESSTIENDGGDHGGEGGMTIFMNSATAASANITDSGGPTGGAGMTVFHDNSTAGTAHFENYGGESVFMDNSTAGNGTIELQAALISGGTVGQANFLNNSTASNATLILDGGSDSGELGGIVYFYDSSSAGSATVTVNGSSATAGGPASLAFYNTSSAGSSTITVNGGSATSADGGTLLFGQNSSASAATLIANGGTNGGSGGYINFIDSSDGGSAVVEVEGNATLGIDQHNPGTVTIGSVLGSGNVHLGGNTLNVNQTIAREFYTGAISDNKLGGSLIKNGSGTLYLGGASTYTGPTTVAAGDLEVNGSLTSDVTVNRGATLSGQGTVGNITLTSGGFISVNSYYSGPITRMTAKSLLWDSGSTMNFNIFGPISYLSLSGALDTDSGNQGPLVFDFHSMGTPRVGQTVNLIGFTSEDIPLADFVSEPGDGFNGVFSYNNNNLQFTFKSVPEPSSHTLLLAALLGVLVFRRSRLFPNL